MNASIVSAVGAFFKMIHGRLVPGVNGFGRNGG